MNVKQIKILHVLHTWTDGWTDNRLPGSFVSASLADWHNWEKRAQNQHQENITNGFWTTKTSLDSACVPIWGYKQEVAWGSSNQPDLEWTVSGETLSQILDTTGCNDSEYTYIGRWNGLNIYLPFHAGRWLRKVRLADLVVVWRHYVRILLRVFTREVSFQRGRQCWGPSSGAWLAIVQWFWTRDIFDIWPRKESL